MSLPRHPFYKDSGVDWLGAIPASWRSVPLWTLFRRVKKIGYGSEQLLSVYRDYGVIPKASRDDNNNRASDDLSVYQLVEPGDLAVNKMKAWQGSVGISEHRGIVSPAYFVYHAVHEENARYLHYLLRSPRYFTGYLSMSKGIRVNQWDLDPRYHSRMPVVLPPSDEQAAIASFLNHEIAKIDALIAEQKKLVALLAEKRQATISHAVTRGLDPLAPMKDSGVPWLGALPAHWEVRPLKHLTALKSGGTPSKDRLDYWKDGSIPWASAKDLKAEVLHDTADHLTSLALEEGAAELVAAGSVLVVVRGMILARTFPVSVAGVPTAINQDLKAVMPVNGLTTSYLPWLLRGTAAESLRRLDEAGHGTKALRMEAWLTMAVPVPPKHEQEAIASHLCDRLLAIDALLLSSAQADELLQERRSALITAAVTGQIDVRRLTSSPATEPEALAA